MADIEGYPYPLQSDMVDVAQHLQDLATAVSKQLGGGIATGEVDIPAGSLTTAAPHVLAVTLPASWPATGAYVSVQIMDAPGGWDKLRPVVANYAGSSFQIIVAAAADVNLARPVAVHWIAALPSHW